MCEQTLQEQTGEETRAYITRPCTSPASSASRGLHFAAELVYTQNETGYTFRVWRERDRGFQCSRPSGNLTLRTIRGKVEVEVNPLPGISRHHDWSRSLLKLMCSEFIPFQMIKDQKLVEKCDSPSKTE